MRARAIHLVACAANVIQAINSKTAEEKIAVIPQSATPALVRDKT
jgi:hypothetical protein